MYQCVNPETGFWIITDHMGEMDFWASLGYDIRDFYAIIPHALELKKGYAS